MTRLAWTLARAGGWARMLLIGLCTAVVSGLLLVGAAILRLPTRPQESLFNLVAEPGLRGGTAFGTVLLTVPLLLLLYQVVRLGTASRERRYAALRVAGATPGEVRRLGAVDVGLPAAAGGVLGFVVYGVMRAVLGGTGRGDRGSNAFATGLGLELVPTTVAPTWWQLLLVPALVTGLGLAVGWRVSGRVALTPVGVVRGQPARPPRPWGLLALLPAPLPLVWASMYASDASTLAGICGVALAVLGAVALASWAAYRIGRWAEDRAASPVTLLAARRLVAEPRPAGRAAAAIGGIALVSGGAGAVGGAVVSDGPAGDSFFAVSLALLAVALLAALVAAAGALAVHSVESVLDRRRAVAALAAVGTPVAVLERAQRREAAMVALPMATGGVALGALAAGTIGVNDGAGVLVLLANAVVTVALVWLALHAATRAVRPWLVRAADASNLRTE